MTRPFEPGSEAEADAFITAFCERCQRDAGLHPCSILLRGASLAAAAAEFPPDWIRDESGAGLCTAFLPLTRRDGAVVIIAEVSP